MTLLLAGMNSQHFSGPEKQGAQSKNYLLILVNPLLRTKTCQAAVLQFCILVMSLWRTV